MKELVKLPFLHSGKNTITVFRSNDSDIRKKLATQMALEWANPFTRTILHVPTNLPSTFCQLVMKGLSTHPYGYRLIEFIDTPDIYQTHVNVLKMTTMTGDDQIHLISVLENGALNVDVAKAFSDMQSLMTFGKKHIAICIICDKWRGQKDQIQSFVDNWYDANEVGGELVLTRQKSNNTRLGSKSIRLTIDPSDDLYPYRMKP